MILKRILDAISLRYHKSSSSRYLRYLRKQGVVIGENCHIRRKTIDIDLTRPSLITIGENCYFNEYFTLLTHDWVSHVFIHSGREFIPSSGPVHIGNNVCFGKNVTVLKGVSIGDNCFIGANSLVTRDIPANSIAAGSPCKVISSLDEYYDRRKKECIEEAKNYARSILTRYGRIPHSTDFREEFPLFIDKDNIQDYPEMQELIRQQCGPSYENYINHHIAPFHGLQEFLKTAGISNRE